MERPEETYHAIHPAEAWKERLRAAVHAAEHRSVVFVLGDGVARDDGGGAWGVQRVLEVLDHDYGIREPRVSSEVPEADAYGQRLEVLKARLGQAEVAKLFRRVVLAACKLPETNVRRSAALGYRTYRRACEQLMENPDDWYLPKGVEALAQILWHISGHRRALSTCSMPPL